MSTEQRAKARTKEGVVVSDSMEKSAVVLVRRRVKHRRYHKYVNVNKRYLIHDPRNECAVGDRVVIAETRPLSLKKRWRLREITKKAVVTVEVIDDAETLAAAGAAPDEAAAPEQVPAPNTDPSQ
ncbi:MAG: 30S ribosomal protein S17 [Deltaproteobacteria bacterium]